MRMLLFVVALIVLPSEATAQLPADTVEVYLNFDGHADRLIHTESAPRGGNEYYDVHLFDPTTERYCYADAFSGYSHFDVRDARA